MAYKIKRHNAFQKGFNKIDPQNQKTFLLHLEEIVANPSIGEHTKGPLHKLGLLKFKVTDTRPQYRLVYKLDKCDKPQNSKKFICSGGIEHTDKTEYDACQGCLHFVLCGTREMFNNLYHLPMDKLKKYL